MRFHYYLFAFAFLLSPVLRADDHIGAAAGRSVKSAKDSKIEALEKEIAKAEIRTLELDLEVKKMEKLGEASRTRNRIDADRAENEKRLKEKREELEITKGLYNSQCKAKLFIYEKNVSVYDRDSGIQTGVKARHFIGCQSVADTCGKEERVRALITSFGSDVQEEEIYGKTDPREGKECQCLCVGSRF